MYSRLWGGRFLSHLRSLVCVSALDLCSRSVCGVWSCETCSSVSVFIESLKNSRVCAQWVTLFLLLFLWKLPGNLSGISHCYSSWWHHPHVHTHVSCAFPASLLLSQTPLPHPLSVYLCVCVCCCYPVRCSTIPGFSACLYVRPRGLCSCGHTPFRSRSLSLDCRSTFLVMLQDTSPDIKVHDKASVTAASPPIRLFHAHVSLVSWSRDLR